jgi:hypothetical protein
MIPTQDIPISINLHRQAPVPIVNRALIRLPPQIIVQLADEKENTESSIDNTKQHD